MMMWCLLGLSFLMCHVIYAADIDYLRSTITKHFSENRHHEINNTNKVASKEFIYNEFKRFGLETSYHNFSYPDISKVPFANVVGILKGTNFGKVNDKIIGLGAHFDTVQHTKGVDDNGAGVAAMLEVAKQLTGQNKQGVTRKNTIIFVSFDLEEEGYIGSEVFIQHWLNPWLDKNYGKAARSINPHGIIILDTIMEYNTSSYSQKLPNGAEATFHQLFPKSFESMKSDNFQGDFLAMIYRKTVDDSLSTSMTKSWAAEKRTQFEIESFPLPFANVSALNQTLMNSFGNFFRSDHRNFWRDNIPAIFLTDSGNFRGDMVECYHHPCDDLATMLTDDNINFLGKTSDAIVRSINELSEPTKPDTSGCIRVSVSHAISALMVLTFFIL
ncbi:uncharacterized protein YfbL-like isoform X2 [Ruditapes philippinarum]|uniref:uncharacterized protein YfbL-like isoform X1 n=1 Tax=Ruditapes philippinarum TaxID=129788 RepID=UPI00295A7E53|nr:uncharacterized protein YfbL-like isoform X1 [Ruditapes philippinarum]XP_060603517.1 uncharacterized protein YfbL-like isoform X2 [Ruditapes philippinarum]